MPIFLPSLTIHRGSILILSLHLAKLHQKKFYPPDRCTNWVPNYNLLAFSHPANYYEQPTARFAQQSQGEEKLFYKINFLIALDNTVLRTPRYQDRSPAISVLRF